MAIRKNGNGRKNGDQGGERVPRWVRNLFDLHEARMAEMERSREQSKAEHEERMADHEERMAELERKTDDLERHIRKVEQDGAENRRQTRALIAEFARMDAQRARDSKALVAELKQLHVRVTRIENR